MLFYASSARGPDVFVLFSQRALLPYVRARGPADTAYMQYTASVIIVLINTNKRVRVEKHGKIAKL